MDILAFVMVIRQLWGLWKVKRSLGLQNSQDLTTSLLEQGRYIHIETNIISHMLHYSTLAGILRFSLSTLLMCEFTIDLRRRNKKDSIPNQSALNLPTLSFKDNPVQSIRSILGRLHESIVAEMGEGNHSRHSHGDNLGPCSEEPKDMQGGDDQVTDIHTTANDLVQRC
ncbi:hypothetical protein Clacol_009753 [Clathrus columnatus]|uniref:Uncharacterized protein n=1 Tax=Clathrus columnatus TaxID=1419009 RepID=A0AAV5AUB0_9AGAM|nr:hypothetical protein Clacol_009753 [Clathrus columnatus]